MIDLIPQAGKVRLMTSWSIVHLAHSRLARWRTFPAGEIEEGMHIWQEQWSSRLGFLGSCEAQDIKIALRILDCTIQCV